MQTGEESEIKKLRTLGKISVPLLIIQLLEL